MVEQAAAVERVCLPVRDSRADGEGGDLVHRGLPGGQAAGQGQRTDDDDSHFVIGCGSSVPDEDDALFTQIAERFEFLSGLGSPGGLGS